MAVYTFLNKNTQETFELTMPMSDREPYLKDNPHLQQLIVSAPSLGSVERLGLKKPDQSFRDMVKYIKKRNPGSTINDL